MKLVAILLLVSCSAVVAIDVHQKTGAKAVEKSLAAQIRELIEKKENEMREGKNKKALAGNHHAKAESAENELKNLAKTADKASKKKVVKIANLKETMDALQKLSELANKDAPRPIPNEGVEGEDGKKKSHQGEASKVESSAPSKKENRDGAKVVVFEGKELQKEHGKKKKDANRKDDDNDHDDDDGHDDDDDDDDGNHGHDDDDDGHDDDADDDNDHDGHDDDDAHHDHDDDDDDDHHDHDNDDDDNDNEKKWKKALLKILGKIYSKKN